MWANTGLNQLHNQINIYNFDGHQDISQTFEQIRTKCMEID